MRLAKVESSRYEDIWDEKSRTWDLDLLLLKQLNETTVLELSSRLLLNVQTIICPHNTKHVTRSENLLELFMKKTAQDSNNDGRVKKWSLAWAPGLLCLDVEVPFF